MNCKRLFLMMALFAMSAGTSFADQVFNDDLIVQGNMCVGFDCVNNETFTDTLKVKENNTRIDFYDSTSSAPPGDRWQITANDSNDGGDSYLAFERVIDTLELVLSDGASPGYDSSGNYYGCFAGIPPTIPSSPCLPVGDQVYDQYGNPLQTVTDTDIENGLKVLAGSRDGIVLGAGSTITYNAVSVGSPGNERRLSHVADGVDAHDAVTLGQLYRLDPFAIFTQQLNAVSEIYDRQAAEADDLEEGTEGAAAVAAAMSALTPNSRAVGNNHIGFGIGAYDNSVAVAAGYFRVVSANAMINVALSGTGDLDGAVSRVGFSYQW